MMAVLSFHAKREISCLIMHGVPSCCFCVIAGTYLQVHNIHLRLTSRRTDTNGYRMTRKGLCSSAREGEPGTYLIRRKLRATVCLPMPGFV